MRLLKKEEIAKAKTLERQATIEEGLKLAHKVDALREILPREQRKLEEFRSETLASIHKDITAADERKTALLTEVKELEARRVAALNPIDALWEEVRKKDAQVTKEIDELDRREAELSAQEQFVKKDLKKAADELKRATNLKESALEASIKADEDREEAQHLLENAAEIKRKADQYKHESEHEIRIGYTQLSNHEKSLTIREAELAKNIKENNEETVRLADMRATLERAFKRIKK